jgi:nitrate/nitrite transport system substrate-binding protein
VVLVVPTLAEAISRQNLRNPSGDPINQPNPGRYQDGMGKTWDDPNFMKFYDNGAATFPYLSDGMWFLTQHKRWGLLKDHPDYLAVAKAVNRIDIYKQAATASGTPLPASEMRSSKFVDGVVWDGKDPKKYADSFKVKA